MTNETPLASGRDADVYAIDADRVLRRYRAGGDVAAEVAVMRYVAGHGFPVPRVYAANGPDLIMERLTGPTLAQALITGELAAPHVARILADLNVRLHALPPQIGPDPADRILHLDLHPLNVIMSPHGPVLIDWRNTREGPPDLDLALSALILAQVAVDPEFEHGPAATAVLADFVVVTDGDPLRLLDRAVGLRRTDHALTDAEIDRLDAAAALVRSACARIGADG